MLGLKVSVMLLSVLDILLTHYMLWWDKNNGLYDIAVEKAAVAKMIFNKFGVNPRSFLLATFLMIIFFTFMFNVMPQDKLKDVLLIAIGVFSTVNFYHIYQIDDQKLLENPDVFKAYKEYRDELRKSR